MDKLVVRGRGGGEEEKRKRGERGGKGDRVRQGERAIGRVNEISGHARVVRDVGGGGRGWNSRNGDVEGKRVLRGSLVGAKGSRMRGGGIEPEGGMCE